MKSCEAPSIRARIKPPIIACLNATEVPPRIASNPPVTAPATIAFFGSSFPRYEMSRQSMVENMPPQRAKLPPKKGARFLTWHNPLKKRWPLGAFMRPSTRTHTRGSDAWQTSTALTFDEVEDGAKCGTDGEPIAQVFEDASGTRLPVVLYFGH